MSILSVVYIYLKCPLWGYIPLISLLWSCSWIPNGLLASKASLRKALSWIIWGYRVITASDVYIDKMVRVCIWGALCNSFLPWCEWLSLVFCTGEELDSFTDLTALQNNKSVVPRAVLFFHITLAAVGGGGRLCPLLPLETSCFGATVGNYQKQISLQQISLKRLWKLKLVIFRRKTVITKE